jgi:hypothetical protein
MPGGNLMQVLAPRGYNPGLCKGGPQLPMRILSSPVPRKAPTRVLIGQVLRRIIGLHLSLDG